MQTVKLKDIQGDYHVQAVHGVFLTLLAMQWQNINGELFYLPTKIGFKEWQALGESVSFAHKMGQNGGFYKVQLIDESGIIITEWKA